MSLADAPTAAPTVIAVDVGGTAIKAALVDEHGAVRRRADRPTPVAEGPEAVVAAVRAAIGSLQTDGVVAAGVVVPGVVDPIAGVARYSANIGWRDVPLAALVAADLAVPVALDHDVQAAGLAELTFGRARGVADCLVVVIGTGIAGVVIAGGQHVRGASGQAGEIGHVPVHPDGDRCACGQRGCAETYASAAAIRRRYRDLAGHDLEPAEIVAAAGADPADPIAVQVWHDATEALGLAIAGYTMLLDPGLIVLAGGLAGAGAALRDPVHAELIARLTWRPAPGVEVSPLGGRAGELGAALLAWRTVGSADTASWVF